MYKFKAIKPPPYKEANVNKVYREFLKDFGALIGADWNAVTDGWEGARPEFKAVYRAGLNWMQISLEPQNDDGFQKWVWLDKGTEGPYPIEPVNAPALRFQAIYTPGSTPGRLRTGKGQSSGPFIYAQHVEHPGIEPRHWSEDLMDEWKPKFKDAAREASRQAAVASGHSKK